MARNNNKRKENYFSRNVRDMGVNFVDEKSAELLSIEAPRIIRDMVTGKVQYEDYIQYIAHPKMIMALTGYCNRKLQFHSVCAEACKVALAVWEQQGIPITPEMQAASETNTVLTYCYTILLQTLQYIDSVPDPEQLMVMTSQIHTYANYIIKY